MPKFELEKFCSTIQKHKITFAYVVPPIILLLGKHPVIDKYDLGSLRMMNSGAAPLTRELVDQVYQRLKVPIKQGYGLSETSPTTHTQVNNLSHTKRCKGMSTRGWKNKSYQSEASTALKRPRYLVAD